MKFEFTELVPIPPGSVVSAALGVDKNAKFAQIDVGKGVKMGAAHNYVLLADGDDIEGVVVAVAPHTVNDGFSFGSVQKAGRVEAVVQNGGGGALAVGAYVVSAAPVALGTAGKLTVKAGAGVSHKWRVISRMGGNGANGTTVLIERV